MNAPDPLAIGARLGPYVLQRELGRGGMAVVFEAEHVELRRRVALKVVLPEFAKNPVIAARFGREGRAAARVRHPHVVDVIDVGVEGSVPYLVMELVDGPTLASLLAREAPMPPARIAELLLPIASAVARAHACGVVHRDLKPANVLVATDLHGEPIPKVSDFGISKIADGRERELTGDQGLLGTLAYMAPEQVQRAATVDGRADQWSLGVILYEAATGRSPFPADTAGARLHAILHEPIDPPSLHRSGLPPAFDALIARALARAPEARFPTVTALGAALLPFAEGRVWATWARQFGGENSDTSGTVDAGALDDRPLGEASKIAAPEIDDPYGDRPSQQVPVVQPTSFERRARGRAAAFGAATVVAVAVSVAVVLPRLRSHTAAPAAAAESIATSSPEEGGRAAPTTEAPMRAGEERADAMLAAPVGDAGLRAEPAIASSTATASAHPDLSAPSGRAPRPVSAPRPSASVVGKGGPPKPSPSETVAVPRPKSYEVGSNASPILD
jgi:serine/threonine-protein kinase